MNINTIRNNISNFYKKKKEESREANNRYSNKWYKYYHDNRWHRLREWKYLNNPICENCWHYGIVIPAEHVHHRIPFGTGIDEQEKYKLLLDPYNLVSVCRECHELYHEHLRQGHNDEWPKPKWMEANENF